MHPVLKKLGLSVPIIQAPMAGVSTAEMAAAVSNGGGLGSIGVGAVDAPTARGMIAAVRRLSDRPLNVNVFCHRPAVADRARQSAWLAELAPQFDRFGAKPPRELKEIYTSFVENEALLEVLLAERPGVVSFHFGLPKREWIAALKKSGSVLLASATNLAEAGTIAAASIDAVVAQGFEAGGHRGTFDPQASDDCLGTLALTRLLVSNLQIPVIAAGGIMDGAGVAGCLVLGASAAQLGTAFVACPESSADADYRAALLSGTPTIMTRAISGRAARGLVNRLTAVVEPISDRVPAYPIAYDAAKALIAAAKAAGQAGYGAQWAGQGAPLARAMPAAALLARLKIEMDQALSARVI
jgi:nitronate monooxygenase